MPKIHINAGAYRRVTILDEVLRRDRWFSRKQLLEYVNDRLLGTGGAQIAESTLRNDLDLLAEKAKDNLLIETRTMQGNLKTCYRYADVAFSIFKLPPLDTQDFSFLMQAIALLQQIRGLDGGEQLRETIQKLQLSVPNLDQNPIFLLDTVEGLRGNSHLQPLYEAILEKKAVSFLYKAFYEATSKTVVLHPYLLKEFNNRWYVVGFNPIEKAHWAYALDRMEAEPKYHHQTEYMAPESTGFQARQFYQDVVGMTIERETEVVSVILRFAAGRAPYERTKPLHHSQQWMRRETDGSEVFGYRLRPNKELVAAILQFGADVEVLEPQSLRTQVATVVAQMLDRYS